MKKRICLLNGIQRIWLCLILLLVVGVLPIAATGDYYYYNTTATASPTAGGRVYVSTESTNNPAYTDTGSDDASGRYYGGDNASLTFFFYAKANENWIFDHWAQGSATGPNVSTSPSYNVLLTFNGTRSKPTQFNYYAVFRQQTGLIKVRSTDESKGSVSINNSDNTEGQEVTLTAYPDVSNGVMFLGWKKNNTNTGEYVSKDNPLKLTAGSDTEGTYYAYFSDAADKAYIRLRNKKTGRFLSFYGNNNETKAPAHKRIFDSNSYQDGFIFTGSLKMISATDAQGNPETVFLRTGHSAGTGVMNGVDLTAHEVKYSTLVGANTSNNQYMLTIENRNGNYRIFTPFSFQDGSNQVILSSYLCDEGEGQNQNYAVMKTEVTGEEADWELFSLDETTSEGAFGANTKAKFTKGGMYYTTMYTDFPYKMLDGVNAYYLVFQEELTHITDVIVFTQVEGNIVPANTAVILECQNVQNDISSTATVTNRLVPLLPNADGTGQIVNEGANFLKGYISVNGNTVANNKKRMYVLSTNKEGVLGFHPYSKATMTPNKAYLLAPEATDEQRDEYAKKLTFSFGEPDIVTPSDPTGIELSDQMVDEDDSTPVYNLNGTKVAEGKAAENMLRPGVYVKKGKKFVVK